MNANIYQKLIKNNINKKLFVNYFIFFYNGLARLKAKIPKTTPRQEKQT